MIVGANVLLYAVDEQSHSHTSARTWLEKAMNGAEHAGLPWTSLVVFQRIITHPRISANPLKPADAWRCITDWLNTDQAWMPDPGNHHGDILGRLPVDGDLHGNFTTDAHLVAPATEHGTGVCPFDSDFARLDGIHWIDLDHGQHRRLMPRTPPPTRSWGDTQ